ncbi:MAG: acyl-CoA dehydrogenase [Actinomycetia bacterium]|nr:acyl-CoA dehydrogenase [Actinomycetes bacterium]
MSRQRHGQRPGPGLRRRLRAAGGAVQFGYDDDQEALQESAGAFFATRCTSAFVRATGAGDDGWRALWVEMVELGWTALLVPEEYGGSGARVADVVALLDVAGRYVVPAPLVTSSGLAVAALLDAARVEGPDVFAETLHAIAHGTVAALVRPEPGRGGDPALGWDGRVLRGQVEVVADAPRADVFVIACAAPDGSPTVLAVPAGAARVEVRPSIDPGRPCAAVTFDDAEPTEVASSSSAAGIDVGRTALAAELLGVCDRALTLAVEHAQTRRQFGKAIGSFQAVKHRLADVYVAAQRARTLVFHAAMVLDDPTSTDAERELAAAMANGAASEAAVLSARTLVRTLGALGITAEHDAHLYLRRARSGAALLGGERESYLQVGRLFTAAVQTGDELR